MPISIPRIKAIWPWLMEYRYTLFGVSVVGLALAISLYACPSERWIRYTGLILQLFGIATVIWGISITRGLFGHASSAAQLLGWLSRFPLLKQHHNLAVGSGTMMALTSKARGYQTSNPPQNATTEQRFESLERNVHLINERITGTQNELDSESRKTAEALQAERAARETADNLLNERLQETSLGGVHISTIGALWLFVGVILSTAAPEISQWMP